MQSFRCCSYPPPLPPLPSACSLEQFSNAAVTAVSGPSGMGGAWGNSGNSGGGFGGSGMTQIQQMVSDWVRERGRRGEIFTSQLGGDQVRVHVFKGPHACAWTLNSDGVRILLICGLYLVSRAAVEFLCNEGHIYSTIDDEHFKSTDNYS